MKTDMKQANLLTSKLRTLSSHFKLVVNGDSMHPTIKNGEEIEVCPIMQIKRDLNVGDIIVYRKSSSHYTVHRIQSIDHFSKNRFSCQTKGDNNTSIDPYNVFSHEIVGIVI